MRFPRERPRPQDTTSTTRPRRHDLDDATHAVRLKPDATHDAFPRERPRPRVTISPTRAPRLVLEGPEPRQRRARPVHRVRPSRGLDAAGGPDGRGRIAAH